MKNVTDEKVIKAFANLKSNANWQTILQDYIQTEYDDLKEALVREPNIMISGQAQALRFIIKASKI